MQHILRPLTSTYSSTLLAAGGSDVGRQHQTCVRQIRLNFLRWFKSFVPHLVSQASLGFGANPPTSDLTLLLRRAFFLEVSAPIDALPSGCRFSPFYAAEELWPAEQDQK